MTTKKTVGFGLLGAGLIAPFHARSIRAAEGCELIAVADLDAKRRQKVAAEFGCEARESLDGLLSDQRIDCINVLLPNHLHKDAAVAAAAAGKHVLTEKPLAMSLADADAMIAACRKAKVKLGVVFQCRVRRPIQAMREAIAAGRFGRLLQADAYMKWHRTTEYYFSDPWRSSRRSGAGVTIQHALHYIDLLTYLMGPARRATARMMNVAHPKVELEDSLQAFIDFECGGTGVVVASTGLWPGLDVRIELHGENGTAVMVGEHVEVWRFRDERPEDEQIRSAGRVSVHTAAGGPADFDFADHQVVIEGMAEAIRTGGEPVVTADSARHTLEIALAMYKSAATGEPAELPVTDEESIWA